VEVEAELEEEYGARTWMCCDCTLQSQPAQHTDCGAGLCRRFPSKVLVVDAVFGLWFMCKVNREGKSRLQMDDQHPGDSAACMLWGFTNRERWACSCYR
jgi:hypothetical protein